MATYKFKLYPSATLKAKVLPAINSEIVATNGLQASKDGGVVTVEPDYGSLAVQPTVVEADREFVYMPAWNSLTETHTRIAAQTFIDGFAASLQAVAALAPAADKYPYFTSASAAALGTITSFGRSLVDDADASTALTTLGVSTFAKTILDDADASAALTTLGVSYASQAEAEAGTASDRVVAPAAMRDYVETGDSFLQSGTGAVVRALQDKVREVVSVKDFGALGDGSDAATAFQAAVDAVTDGATAVIHVPSGTYDGALSSLSIGTRLVIWSLGSNVTFTTSKPKGTIIGTAFESLTNPAMLGRFVFGSNGTADSSDPNYKFVRRTTHTDASYGSAVGLALEAVSIVSTDVANFEYVANFQLLEETALTAAQDLAGVMMTAVRKIGAVGSLSSLWGGNAVVIDETTRKSSVSGGELRGFEVNVSASGPDDNDSRFGLDVILFERDTSTDGATSHYAGVRVIPASALSGSLGAVTIKNGFVVDRIGSTGTGDILVGYTSNASTTSFLAQGSAPSNGILRANISGGSANVVMGTAQKTSGDVISAYDFYGQTTDGTAVQYGRIKGTVLDPANGAQDGGIYLQPAVNGTITDGLVVLGVDDAIFIRVGGTLKQVVAGAADSGGSGFKMLRIAN